MGATLSTCWVVWGATWPNSWLAWWVCRAWVCKAWWVAGTFFFVTILHHDHYWQGGMGGGMPMNNSQLSSMWGGMPGRSMGMGRGMMEVCMVHVCWKRALFHTTHLLSQGLPELAFGMLVLQVWSKLRRNILSSSEIAYCIKTRYVLLGIKFDQMTSVWDGGQSAWPPQGEGRGM